MQIGKWTLILAAAVCLHHTGALSATAVCSAQMRRANLDFKLRDVAGHEIALSRFRGKVLLINFWATWCAPCRVEIPEFSALYRKYRERGLVILGVSVDDPVPRLASFVARLGVTYPVLVGAQRHDFLDAYGPPAGFPTSLLISRQGKVCAQYTGPAEREQLEQRIRALLQTNMTGSLGLNP